MSSVDPTSRHTCSATCAQSESRPPRRSTFSTILRNAATIAAAALPVVGPAIASAVDRSRIASVAGLNGTSETLKYLELQRAIEQETRAFETASNVMKARHDATMNSIRNLKS